MSKHPNEIFKAYDIRGIVTSQLTQNIVESIGKVLASMALEQNINTLVVGYDGRLSSPQLAQFLIAGILSTGCNVYNIGEVTTPMVYFANYFLQTNSGIMITGSHNPPEYNGFKMVINSETLSSEKIQQISQRIQNGDFIKSVQGKCEYIDITEEYLKKIISDIKLKRKLKLVVDCGNGVAGKIAPKLFRRMGANVLELFCNVDGNFPNHHPDPSKPENLEDLIHAVRASNADFGFAFDGDADRLGVVTCEGNIIYPDRQMMLFIADILETNPNSKIIYDVKSTRLLKQWIIDNQGVPIISKTGHSFIKALIKETNAIFAGEMSGHLFFNDRWYGFDDGIYAGARLLEILSKVEDPSALLNALPNNHSTPEINIAVAEGQQHIIVENIKNAVNFEDAEEIITIDGLRVEYKDGFGLIRASNTTPVLVLRFEADTLKALKRIQNQFKNLLIKYVTHIPF